MINYSKCQYWCTEFIVHWKMIIEKVVSNTGKVRTKRLKSKEKRDMKKLEIVRKTIFTPNANAPFIHKNHNTKIPK